MKSAIGVASIFITVVCLAILKMLAVSKTYHKWNWQLEMVITFTFTVFIYAVIFNSLNTRNDSKHIGENKKFSIVNFYWQTLIIQFGGKVFSTVPMDVQTISLHYRGFDYPLQI